ncbi:MAG: hypothetical protein R2769_10385 [Saprospiraceae bacterium]
MVKSDPVLISANLQKEDNFEGYESAIIRDITERKQTEQLIKARDILPTNLPN